MPSNAKPIDVGDEPFDSRAKLKCRVSEWIDEIGCIEDWSSGDPARQRKTAFLWQVMHLHPASDAMLPHVVRVALRRNATTSEIDVWLCYADGRETDISVRQDCVYFEQTARRMKKKQDDLAFQIAMRNRVDTW